MERLNWLKKLVEKNKDDAQAWYWLGKEYAASHQHLEAIHAYAEGLKFCGEDLHPQLLTELSASTAMLGGQGKEDEGSEQHSEVLPVQDNSSQGNDAVKSLKSKVNSTLKVISGGKISDKGEDVSPAEITFTDVAGLDHLKKTIRMKIISPFQNQGLFSKFRKKAGGGVLLYGPPGCGKTYMARATAGECGAAFIPVHITDILDPYIGVSEQNLKDLFEKARFRKPSIMFFDEIDAIGYSRAKSTSHLRGLVDTFLAQMEGVDTSTDQVLFIGATNMPWDVDNALKRPGRFDRLIFVSPPDEEAREHIFRLKLEGRYIDNIDYSTLAKRSNFFSGADIEHVCDRSAEYVLEEIMETEIERPIRMQDLTKAIAESHPSTLEWLRTAKNYVKYANQSGIYNDIEDYLKKYGKHL